MAAPVFSASSQRGSGGVSRADPMNANESADPAGPPGAGAGAGAETESACDELIATHPLLTVQRDDGTAQHPFGVLAARVDGQRPADPCLAARLVDVTLFPYTPLC